MLTKPLLLNSNIVIDATENYTFKFNVIGGDQVVKNEIKIQEIATNTVIFNDTTTSFQLQHIIPANTMINKKEYKVRVRTYNINNEVSVWSDYCIVKCFAKPIVSITNLQTGVNGKTIVNNQTYIFQGNIVTDGDTLQSYKYYLYDDGQVLLDSTPSLFDGLLQYQFTGLKDGVKYYIELRVLTQNNVEASSGLILFTPTYIKPRVKNVLKLTNDYNNAGIKIETNVIQVVFRKLSGNISYEIDDWIDLKQGSIIAENKDGFSLKGNWTLKMWVKDLVEDKPFLTLYDKYNNTIEFIMYNDRIHVFKKQGANITHIYSEILGITSGNDVIFIFAQKENEFIEIKAEKQI